MATEEERIAALERRLDALADTVQKRVDSMSSAIGELRLYVIRERSKSPKNPVTRMTDSVRERFAKKSSEGE